MNGFSLRPLKAPGFLSRLLGIRIKENAFIEIENLLATREIASLIPADIEGILASYKVRPGRARKRLVPTFKTVLEHFASDSSISDEEADNLRRLRDLFGLVDADVRAVEAQVQGKAYSMALDTALADGHLSRDEHGKLARLIRGLRLDEELAKQIYANAAEAVVQSVVGRVIEDRRLSSEEDAQIKAVCENLGVSLSVTDATPSDLERYRTYWRADQGDFPEILVPFKLQRGEKCFHLVNASQHEIRSVTVRTNYSGPSYSFRIAKGLSYRVGSIKREPVKKDVLHKLEEGTLYFTTKRVFLDGARKNTSIALNKIANFETFSDGVRIEKETGKDQFFLFDGTIDNESLDILLDAAIRATHR